MFSVFSDFEALIGFDEPIILERYKKNKTYYAVLPNQVFSRVSDHGTNNGINGPKYSTTEAGPNIQERGLRRARRRNAENMFPMRDLHVKLSDR